MASTVYFELDYCPGPPANSFHYAFPVWFMERPGSVGRLVGKLWSRFELPNGRFGEGGIKAEIVRFKDRAHITTRVPVSMAISASVRSALARRVTAVPRKSWNVSPTMPALSHARALAVWKPAAVHGEPDEFTSVGDRSRFRIGSSMALRAEATGITTRTPVSL